MYYVYMLWCRDDTLYTGTAADLCRRMQQALGLEEDACQTAVCAILAQSQDRLPQLRDRLTAAEQ